MMSEQSKMAELLRIQKFEFRPELSPVQEFTKDNIYWFSFSPEQTGLKLVCAQDLKTGLILTTPLGNERKRLASFKAWTGARHSRAPGYPWEIMAELVQKSVDTDAKLEKMVVETGHASPGSIARGQIDLVNAPMHLIFSLFNLSAIYSGQEKSTRFQDMFATSNLHALRNYLPESVNQGDLTEAELGYQELADLALENYSSSRKALDEAFTRFFKPETPKEQKSLNSRVLDCARYHLLFGQVNSQTYETTFRDLSRIIGELKASPIPSYQKVAGFVEKFLAPDPEVEEKLGFLAEAPSLIRHAEKQGTTNENLQRLKDFLMSETEILLDVSITTLPQGLVEQGVKLVGSHDLSEIEKVIFQRILSIWPGMDTVQLAEWVKRNDLLTKSRISKTVLEEHTDHKELPMIDATTSLTLVYDATIGEIRDLNRHGAWGRFLPLPLVYGLPINVDTAYQILASGFGLPSYLDQIQELSEVNLSFFDDLKRYYSRVYQFVGKMERTFGDTIDYSFVVNLLPMAHHLKFWMHGDPKQVLYLPSQRVRPGGHINYRLLTYMANQLVANSDPYFSALSLEHKPDPRSRSEFFDRS